jgi:hypothetical protein
MIAHQLTAVASGSLREELLLDSGQVPGISVQHETLKQLYGQKEAPAQASLSSTSGNPMVQAIVQTLAQLRLNLPLSSSSSTGATSSDTNTATQGSNINSHASSISAADIDSIFRQFIGQILQMASSPQQGVASSSASQSNSGAEGNGASAAHYSNPLAQALESLAQAVGAGSSQSGNASGNSGAGSTTPSNTAISSLAQDFNTLFGSSDTGNGTSLQTFFQTFSRNVAQESPSGSSGSFVQTSA